LTTGFCGFLDSPGSVSFEEGQIGTI